MTSGLSDSGSPYAEGLMATPTLQDLGSTWVVVSFRTCVEEGKRGREDAWEVPDHAADPVPCSDTGGRALIVVPRED